MPGNNKPVDILHDYTHGQPGDWHGFRCVAAAAPLTLTHVYQTAARQPIPHHRRRNSDSHAHPNDMHSGQTIRQGVAWVFMGKGGSQVIGFLVGIVLARLLAPEVFGMLLTLQVFTGIAGFVAGGGMGQALVRASDTTREDYDVVFTLQILAGGLIYAAFYFTAPWIAAAYHQPLYQDMIRVMALSFLFRPLTNVPGSILYREMRFKATTLVSYIALLISSSVSITLAYLGYGVWALILGGFASPLVTIPAYMVLARWRPGFSLRFGRAREIARYGFLVSLNDIVSYLREQVSIFILSRTLGPASVGLYNKGESLAKMPHGFITGSVYQVLFRALAAEQDNLDKSRYLFYRSITLVGVYATPFYIGLLWVAEPLVRGLYGDRWADAASPLFILALAWPFWLMDNLSGAVLAAQNWLGRELPVQIATLAISALGILGLLEYGLQGVAWAIFGASVYSALHLYWLATRCLRARARDYLRAIAPAVALNALLACVMAAMHHWLAGQESLHPLLYVAILSGAGACVYGAALLYAPIAALATEQRRWKSRLGLTGRKQA